MKFYTLGISSLFGLIGFIPIFTNPVQAQECSVAPGGSSSIICAKVYNATPQRVQISGAVGELTVNTNPQMGSEIRAFTAAAPSNNSLSPNNVLETATYARADLQFNDGTLVWLKPDTQVTLSSDQTCSLDALQNNALASGIQPSGNQRLCLLSGSALIIAPAKRISSLIVKTDEATVWNPPSIYLVTRNETKKRTEVFVFSGDQIGSVATSANTQTLCGVDATQLQSSCAFRVNGGEYLTVTNQGKSLVKPFDLPAWVVTDPFFEPLRANTRLREIGGTAVLAQGASIQTPTAMNAIQFAQPSLLRTVEYQKFAADSDCPIEGVSDVPLGLAQLSPAQFNPLVLTPPPAYIPPPPPKPIRGMW